MPAPDQIFFVVMILLAAIATLMAQARVLPLQNVFMVALLIVIVSSVICLIGAKTGVPFGPYFYTDRLGYLVFKTLPWPVPLIWLVVLLNARGVAQLILLPWRDRANYGWRSLALTCLLVVVFDVSLEPFASATQGWWIWLTPKNIPAWHGAPWINFPAWAAISLLLLGLALPWLIDKKPVKPTPRFFPLVIWVTLSLLIACDHAGQKLWAASIFSLASTVIIAFYAWKNARL